MRYIITLNIFLAVLTTMISFNCMRVAFSIVFMLAAPIGKNNKIKQIGKIKIRGFPFEKRL